MVVMRVGVLLDEGRIPAWVSALFAGAWDGLNLQALVVSRIGLKQGGVLWEKALASRVLSGISWLEQWLFCRSKRYQYLWLKQSIQQDVQVTLALSGVLQSSGKIHFLVEDLRKIQALSLDVLLVASDLSLDLPLDDLARYGAFTFGIGETVEGNTTGALDSVSLDLCSAFWPVYHRHATTVLHLVKLADGGMKQVILAGHITTAPTMTQNAAHLALKTSGMLRVLLARFAVRHDQLGHEISGGSAPIFVQSSVSLSLLKSPSIWRQVIYLFVTANLMLGKMLQKILGRRWRWGVGFMRVQDWRQADITLLNCIDNPSHHLLADPFVFHHRDQAYLFVEDLDFRQGKGRIAAYALSETGSERIGIVLAEPFHLSYPYVFSVGEDIFMCPETHEVKDIRLYRATRFPTDWVLHCTLMDSVSAADTSIFYHGNRWWMFTNIDSAQMGDHCSELHVFYADSFDSPSWVPHRQNPVVFDARRARNGGLIHEDGVINRVFQVQDFDRYGAAMGIAKVSVLTPDLYQEEVVRRISPDFLPNIHACHTFNAHKGIVAVDFLRCQKTH